MATTIGDLKQIWQTVSNWVNGTDTTAKPKITIAGGDGLYGKLANVTTAGSKIQLANISCREVTVIARKGNTGSIYVGGSDVSSTLFGVELQANESFTFSVSNANLIYIDSSVSGEGISYVVVSTLASGTSPPLSDTTPPVVTMSPVAGTYSSTQTVTLTANETATIYYTVDGTTPTTSSAVYSTPISVSTTKTIKYFAKDTAGNSSTVQTATFTISAVDTTPPVVTSSPAAGTYSATQSVTLSSEAGATIYYTTNGTTPTTASTVYTTPISISATTTLQFIGKDTAGNISTPVAATYTISASSSNLAVQKLAIYYGYPSLVNSSSNLTAATNEFAKHDIIVFPDGVEHTAHGDHNNCVTLVSNLMGMGKKVFGYVPIGQNGSAGTQPPLSLATIQSYIDQWSSMGVYGIFLDEFGYDYGVSRSFQNSVMDYLHGKGLKAMMNAWNVDDACSSAVNASMNPSGLAPKCGVGDRLIMESWIVDNGSVQSLSTWQTKVQKAMAYKTSLGIEVDGLTTITAPSTNNTGLTSYKLAEYAAALYGISSWQWTDNNYSASDNVLYNTVVPTNYGTSYTGSVVTNGTTLTRTTNTGTITVVENGTTYSGTFA